MPSAKRAVLKSPVREFRTPGSVRGQLGNWLFYLDYTDQSTHRIACYIQFVGGE
jgi:hypothetical protein